MKNLRIFTFITCILALIFIFLPLSKVTASEGDLYIVNTTELNMRIAPSNEAKIVGQLEYGSKLTVFAEDDGWGKTFFEGEKVWVAIEFLQPLEEKAEEVEEQNQDETETEQVEEITENKEQHNQPSHSLEIEPDGVDQEEDKNNEPDAREEVTNDKNIPTHTHETREKVKQKKELPPVKTMKPTPVKISKHALSIMDSLANFEIVIDAGHGGKDAGTIQDGILEKNLTLSTAKKVANHLKEAGASVTMTRTNDSFIPLSKRVHISERMNADAFISIHFDSFSNASVKGLTSHYSHNNQSKKLAQFIQNSLTKRIDMKNRGVRHSNFFVLRENSQKAVLLELGFMSNSSDWEEIRSENFQDKVATAVVDGLYDYFYQ